MTDPREHLIMNPAGVYQFRELEMMVLTYLKDAGYLVSTPDLSHHHQNTVGLGNMIIDLIMIADNLGLDLTQCLAAAYLHRTEKDKK